MEEQVRRIDVVSGGVYKIICTANGRAYIGAAGCVLKRVAAHIHELNGNTHVNEAMQADWNQFGQEAFEFYLVKAFEERTDALAYERTLVARASKRKPPLYNVIRDMRKEAAERAKQKWQNTTVLRPHEQEVFERRVK